VDEQARRLGLSLELLARLALCRVPRPECHGHDLDRVGRFVGLAPAVLHDLLRQADPVIDLDALGRDIDTILCTVCRGNAVDAENGFDTCDDCRRQQ
jgi:hypothetical protein